MTRNVTVLILMAAFTTACSSAPTPQRLAHDAVEAMGGAEKIRSIRLISMKSGTGTRFRLGQMPRITDQEPASHLTNVIEIADLANGRASLDYEIRDQAFMQHRHEILTKRGDKPVGIELVGTRPAIATSPSGLFSWGTQNSPDFLLQRNVITTILAAMDAAPDTSSVDEKPFNGKLAQFAAVKTKSGEDLGLYFDPQSKLLAGFDVLDTETILGDVQAQYILTDYKNTDGVKLPYHITIKKDGKDYSDVQYASITLNDPSAEQVFAIPDAAAKQADEAIAAGVDYSPVTLSKVAEGVYFAAGYSHHSMVVEFPKSLVLVEAPYTEAQGKTLLGILEKQFPGKPIQYSVVTHPHYDHLGAVRTIAATGATILVANGHESELRRLLESSHTQPTDELERKRKAKEKTGTIELFEGKKVISDSGQSLELYAFTGSPHADVMVMAFVPNAHVLFQSDLWFPGLGSNGSAGPAAAQHLLDTIRKLNLRVDTNVGGHGGVAPFSEFVKAVAAMPKAAN